MALVELAKYYDSFEAGIVQGRLDAEGIETHLFDFNMAMEGASLLIPIRLMVGEEELEAARRILAQV